MFSPSGKPGGSELKTEIIKRGSLFGLSLNDISFIENPAVMLENSPRSFTDFIDGMKN